MNRMLCLLIALFSFAGIEGASNMPEPARAGRPQPIPAVSQPRSEVRSEPRSEPRSEIRNEFRNASRGAPEEHPFERTPSMSPMEMHPSQERVQRVRVQETG